MNERDVLRLIFGLCVLVELQLLGLVRLINSTYSDTTRSGKPRCENYTTHFDVLPMKAVLNNESDLPFVPTNNASGP